MNELDSITPPPPNTRHVKVDLGFQDSSWSFLPSFLCMVVCEVVMEHTHAHCRVGHRLTRLPRFTLKNSFALGLLLKS